MTTADTRQKLGKQSGVVILISNLVLFSFKYIVGLMSNSVSLQADAINNLTDTVSAIFTIIGFQISAKPRDKKHPNGYGRMEYISGLAIAVMILLAGGLLVKSSIERIISPEPINVDNIFVIIVPAIAIFAKLGLAYYSFRLNKIVESATVKATMKDCLFDAVITLLALTTVILSQITILPIDGAIGILVSLLIIYNGFMSAKENIGLLLGNPLDIEIERKIQNEVAKCREFSGVKEIIANDFGAEHQLVVVELLPGKNHDTASIKKSADALSAVFADMFGFKVVIYWSPE
jgi:cation diffusion facilitator family transporter